MKFLILASVVAVVCIVLFAVGLVSPASSRRMQKTTDRLTRKAEDRGQAKGGRLGNLARTVFKRSRHAIDRSAEAGRQMHKFIRRD